MTRDYVNNIPYIQGQGNLGAVDGSSAAASRYTEVKLDPSADWLLMDGVDSGAVPMVPNYDQRLKEPSLLPVKIPMILLNGVPKGSIGVGFASIIPPHSVNDVAAATKYVLNCMINGENPTIDKIMETLKGPDFPTGGIVGPTSEIKKMYETGSARLIIRSKATIETNGKSSRIIITEIPYNITTTDIVNDIAEAVVGKKDTKSKSRLPPTVPEVKAVRDETTTNRKTKKVDVRIVVDVKNNEDPNVVLEKLMQYTSLQEDFAPNMVALNSNRQPIQVNIFDIIDTWINFRAECIKRLAAADLERYRDREHVINGLLIALPMIDTVVEIIKKAKNDEDATVNLMSKLKITSRQAEAILSMQLRRLNGLRRDELAKEKDDVVAKCDYNLNLLVSQEAIVTKIIDELDDTVRRLGSPRKTQIAELGRNVDPRAFITPEACLVSTTINGYIKRIASSEFKTQLKGGKGRKGAKVKDDDALHSIISCNSHDQLFAITNTNAVVRLEAHEVPDNPSGRHAANLGFEEDEGVCTLLTSVFPIPEAAEAVVATSNGQVKRIKLSDMSSKMTKRLVFYKSSNVDDVVAGAISLPQGTGDVFLASAYGQGVRFGPDSIRITKRDSGGVRGIDLASGDYLVSIGRIDNDSQSILCVTSDGIGKRVTADQFPALNRGLKGRILIKPKLSAYLVAALVTDNDDVNVIIATKMGMTIRLRVGDIRELGRSAMGAKLATLNEGDEVISAAIVPAEIE
jgi:DNA gyrase subunit A